VRVVLDLIDIVCRRRISYMSHASQSDVDIQLVLHKLCLVECTIRMGEYFCVSPLIFGIFLELKQLSYALSIPHANTSRNY